MKDEQIELLDQIPASSGRRNNRLISDEIVSAITRNRGKWCVITSGRKRQHAQTLASHFSKHHPGYELAARGTIGKDDWKIYIRVRPDATIAIDSAPSGIGAGQGVTPQE